MADNESNEAAAEVISEDFPKVEAKDSSSPEHFKEMVSPKQEEEIIKTKYGGLLPKKPPLISNDKEHAFFDSADWALGKAGAHKSKGPLEALRPKLQKVPHSPHRINKHVQYQLTHMPVMAKKVSALMSDMKKINRAHSMEDSRAAKTQLRIRINKTDLMEFVTRTDFSS